MKTITKTTVTEKYDKDGNLVDRTTVTEVTQFNDYYWVPQAIPQPKPYWYWGINTTTNTWANTPVSTTLMLADGTTTKTSTNYTVE
jgi:hypothetical protein